MSWTAAAVRKLRKNLELTQEKFARRIGVTTVTVSRWEKGHSSPQGLSIVMLNQAQKSLDDEATKGTENHAESKA